MTAGVRASLKSEGMGRRVFLSAALLGLTAKGERRVAPAFAIVPYGIPRGCAATYYPEANVLIPLGSYADGSRTPTSKSVIITLERASAAFRLS